jgi:predicted small lipoprotein YifL
MKTALRLAAAAAVFVIVLAGCGGGGDGGPVAPPQTDEIEPNDFTPQSLDTLETSDVTKTFYAGGLGDVDLFSVALAAPGGLFVGVNASADLELSISNGQGIFIRHVDTPGNAESCTLAGLQAGTYLIRVAGFDEQGSSYQLTVGPR